MPFPTPYSTISGNIRLPVRALCRTCSQIIYLEFDPQAQDGRNALWANCAGVPACWSQTNSPRWGHKPAAGTMVNDKDYYRVPGEKEPLAKEKKPKRRTVIVQRRKKRG